MHPLNNGSNHGYSVTNSQLSSAQVERDGEWVVRIRAGDYDAFVACFREYYGRALAFAARLLGTSDGADDVVQDVFFAIWQRRETWVVTSNLGSYIHAAVRNRVVAQFRHRRVRRLGERFVRQIFDRDVYSPHEEVAAADLDVAIGRIIQNLPPRCRAVYELRWYHQLSYAEIAHVLGVSIKTVEAQVAIALKRLRAKIPSLI